MPNKNKRTRRKKSVAKKKTPKRKVARKRVASKQSSFARKKKFSAKRRRVTSTGLVAETVPLVPFSSEELRKQQDGQSGEFQGLSNPPSG
jgi:hypothetical protein